MSEPLRLYVVPVDTERGDGTRCHMCGAEDYRTYYRAKGYGSTVLLCYKCEGLRLFHAAQVATVLEARGETLADVPAEAIYVVPVETHAMRARLTKMAWERAGGGPEGGEANGE